MRELRFRAWVKDHKKFHWFSLGDLLYAKDEYGSIMGNGPDDMYAGFDFQAYPEFEEKYPIMQYTGLKDKNGKEIYEGDIVYIPDMKFEVKFRETICWDCGGNYTGMGYEISEAYEIIGNIYENPELLEKEAQNGIG